MSPAQRKAHSADCVAEGQASLFIPGSGVWARIAGEQIAGPERYEAVKPEQGRGGSQDSFVGPLPLGLDTRMGAGLGERDLDLPAANEHCDDGCRLEGGICAEESLWVISGQYRIDDPARCGSTSAPFGRQTVHWTVCLAASP